MRLSYYSTEMRMTFYLATLIVILAPVNLSAENPPRSRMKAAPTAAIVVEEGGYNYSQIRGHVDDARHYLADNFREILEVLSDAEAGHATADAEERLERLERFASDEDRSLSERISASVGESKLSDTEARDLREYLETDRLRTAEIFSKMKERLRQIKEPNRGGAALAP